MKTIEKSKNKTFIAKLDTRKGTVAIRPKSLNTNRYYFRGFSLLGIFNTLIAYIFNLVVVKMMYKGKYVGFFIDKATNHPKLWTQK